MQLQLVEDGQKMKNSEITSNASENETVTKQFIEETIQEVINKQRLINEKKKNILIFGLKENT